ncbi:helix-turn-helix transcriptional regulator [uncultured Roseibium sp.]|uniref:helix-turn-helix domain-containing protein n=1 Tax=uncultured Roseibium sp. TaxID=1936171 RepID=UPI0026123F77|nr:helix-turn-helix transcriptional regulator [uncultured Roseibium sp.]
MQVIAPEGKDLEPLTVRECECLRELAHGERPQRIAATLGIAPITVDFHIRNARRKLGARTREHAIAIALSYGLLNDVSLNGRPKLKTAV